ncbi:MAG TPA: sulfatase-like hydrolase/transferase [Lacunisphaera sp.]|nr:sulfatase-like hydrolase/transferase [Lacunisphaera sp.]
MTIPSGLLSKLLARRHGGIVLFFAVFLGISFLTRVALLIKAAHDVTWTLSLLAAFGWGLLYDLGAACFASLPLIVMLTVLPSGALRRGWMRWLVAGFGFVILFALLFGAAAEWTFWDEFGVRFNFIAVDYLVYTKEVVGNIRESYPLPLIMGGLFTLAAFFGWMIWRSRLPHAWVDAAVERWPQRYRNGALWFAGGLALGIALNADWLPAFKNNFNRELAKNGLWSLFAAFRNNVLDYQEFYPTKPIEQVFAKLREELAEDGAVILRPTEYDTLRYVRNPGPELRPNVIQITVESLSADFLSIFNHAMNVTPNLTEIAGKSLVFDNFYATGTRTDRGMEALTLSLPPTPGRSMIKRPRNEDMFTLGSVFRAKGYDTAFIYGGFGYFDNMNYFFGHNGYRVVDRQAVGEKDVTVSTIWGACDGDLFRWTLREADASAATGKPFHYFVMTTSNHRPYVYPEGKIDLPPKISGRPGAVKYTDYAIGEFLREAEKKPWYKDTVFVIVADHCASSAGKTELPVQNYHIPLIIYSPGGHIAPGHIKTLTSQIDYAPTLLGLLNWSYPSRFFGHDVRKIEPDEAHALIGNYQKLGHLEKGEFVILRPRGESTYQYKLGADTMTPAAETAYGSMEAISFYQGASYLYEHNLYRALSAEEYKRYSHLGEEKHAEKKAVASQ